MALALDSSRTAGRAGCPRTQLVQLVAVDTRPPGLAWDLLQRPAEAALLEEYRAGPQAAGPGPRSALALAQQWSLQLRFSKPLLKLQAHMISYSHVRLVSLACSGPQECTLRVAAGGSGVGDGGQGPGMVCSSACHQWLCRWIIHRS